MIGNPAMTSCHQMDIALWLSSDKRVGYLYFFFFELATNFLSLHWHKQQM